jgi:hypothetical protein
MSHHDERDLLTNELRQRSAGIGGHPIGLDDVRDRASSIRRRRNAVRGVVAAVVLAVAVPVGLSATDLLGTSGTPAPPVASRSGAPSPSPTEPAPTPGPDGSYPLTVHGLEQGAPAGIPYIDADAEQLVSPEGTVDLPEPYAMITPYNGGYLAIGSSRYPGKVIMLDAGMNVTHTDPAGGSALAVSPDRTHVAYVVRESKTRVMLVDAPTDGTDPVTWQLETPAGETLDPIGFLDDGAVVYSSDTFEEMGVARAGGETTPIKGLLRVEDASAATGLVSGLVSYGAEGGCSGVQDPATGSLKWKSCDYSNLRFSPDGRYVVADASYYDGPGSPTLTILDAGTGDVVTEFKPTARRTVVGVSQAAGEDGDTVLAYVDEGGDQAMVRLRLDGSLERVTDVVTVHDLVVKYWFAEHTRN